jgi:hypothetical protein
MSLVIAHLDSYPEPQDGEATVALSLTVAQPQRRGDAEGWRARATCVESGRVLGRWMSDCPLSAAQSALLWLGLHPWEVLPEEGGYDYADILEQAERPASNDQIHVRDLLERIASNLPPKPSEVRNPVTGARMLRRPPRALLPVREEPEEEEEEEDEDEVPEDAVGLSETDSDGDAYEDDEEDGDTDEEAEEVEEVEEAPRARLRVPQLLRPASAPPAKDEAVDRNRLLQLAVKRLQEGGDRDRIARALEKRGGKSLAETFLAVSTPMVRPVSEVEPVPMLSPEAEEEIARYAVGDEGAVRAKLDRTAQRAAREHARVEAFLAEKARREAALQARQASAPSVPPQNRITLEIRPPSPAPAPEAEPEVEAAAPAPKPRRGRKKAEVVSEESAG